MSEEPAGPDRNTLKNLAGMLPSFMRGLAHKKSVGKGKSVRVPRATKMCPICADGYEKKNLPPDDRSNPEIKNCPACQAQLDAGSAAFVCGDYYAFGMSPQLADMAGQIIQVSPHVMEALKKEFNAQHRKTPSRDIGNN
jgi:Zn-finger nucleic acid-binding protein